MWPWLPFPSLKLWTMILWRETEDDRVLTPSGRKMFAFLTQLKPFE